MDYIVPVQCFTILAAAANFGGSILQSPLVMPALQLNYVPTVYAAHQTAHILHNSEFFFPPTNMLCTLGNLAMTITCYVNAKSNPVAAAKAPRLLAATVLSIATTAWALGIMVPMNKRMTAIAGQLEKSAASGITDKDTAIKQAESEFRRLQNRWRKLNYGRAAIMIGSAIAGLTALLVV